MRGGPTPFALVGGGVIVDFLVVVVVDDVVVVVVDDVVVVVDVVVVEVDAVVVVVDATHSHFPFVHSAVQVEHRTALRRGSPNSRSTVLLQPGP